MDSQLNMFDAAVFCILGLSALIAFFRGFIRELMSLGAWVGATIITVYAFPHSTAFMQHHIKNPDVAAGVGALGTFIAALILISIFNFILMRYLKTGMEVGLLDNFLGLLFGIARGVFILSLSYLLMAQFLPKDPQPKWLQNSSTQPYLKQGSDILVKVAPGYLNDIEGIVQKEEAAIKKEKDNPDNPVYKNGTQQDYDNQINSPQTSGVPTIPN